MNRRQLTAAAPNVLFLGMRCQFSAIVLGTLLDRGVAVGGIAIAGSPGEAGPVPDWRYAAPGTVEARARTAGVPVHMVPDAGAASLLAAMPSPRPAAIAVACFPWRLPPETLALAPFGALNAHPSLLPSHRGPDPLFWSFRRGDRVTGITIHLMNGRFDAGPIVAQRSMSIPFGVDGARFERRLARMGGALLAGAIARRCAGDLRTTEQDESRSERDPAPCAADRVIHTGESGYSAHAFARGVVPLGYSVSIVDPSGGIRIPIVEAHRFTPGGRQEITVRHGNGRVALQFHDGICEFSVDALRKAFEPGIDTGIAGMR